MGVMQIGNVPSKAKVTLCNLITASISGDVIGIISPNRRQSLVCKEAIRGTLKSNSRTNAPEPLFLPHRGKGHLFPEHAIEKWISLLAHVS